KQTSERHKKSGSERPLLPFDGDWLMTKDVSSKLDNKKSGERCFLYKIPLNHNDEITYCTQIVYRKADT
ncbi:hypothetical protein JOC77_003605, partial [Peribacillus deserti]